ncbi:hypothetical protein ABIB90_001422 [Bradyrhizobium sp. JR4.1]
MPHTITLTATWAPALRRTAARLRRVRGTRPPYFFFTRAFGSGDSACGSKPT